MLDMLMIDSGFLCIHGFIRPAFGPLFSLRVLISCIRLSNNNILFSSSYSSFLNESVTLFLCKVYEAKLDIFFDIFFESLRNREPKHYLNMD